MSDNGLPHITHVHLNPAWLAKYSEDVLEPALPIVDPHHHLWDREGGYLLDQLLADTGSGHNVVATVFAQCGYAYRSAGPDELKSLGETEFAAGVARESERRKTKTRAVAGIVGAVDLALGDKAGDVLRAHIEAGGGRFKGIRHITARHEAFNASLLGRPPARQMADATFRKGFAQLGKLGLSFDAWLYHPQIPELTDLARAFPSIPIVLNHVGAPLGVGPYQGKRDLAFREWHQAMKGLATCPNVRVKLGGLGMAIIGFDYHKEQRPPSSERLAADWRPLMETSIELFGANRCMFESNFPVDKGMFSYPVMWNAFKRIASRASTAEKAALFHDTAASFYRL
ncbi:MAG TPA: amidohydrolase family protein [Burkholderiales bacterium]|nr:amidohydrolase family protein [Burkholderiales bacterium]